MVLREFISLFCEEFGHFVSDLTVADLQVEKR